MFSFRQVCLAQSLMVSLLLTHTALAECPSIDFENLPVGTAVVAQYAGVTFTVEPQSCNDQPTLYMRIVNPVLGTSSGAKGLQVDTGCPDFSPDYLRMVFDDLQREVSFNLGEATGVAGWDFNVRYYSDAGLLGTIFCESGTGVFRYVHIGASTGPVNIRRVEVEELIDGFEVIDDLQFAVDTTPPMAMISSPGYETCGCETVWVTGLACDENGEYASDMLEYRRVDADPEEPWTFINSASTAVCEDDYLYSWNTTSVPHGRYYMRLTVFNECGLSSTAVGVVYVDKQFDTVDARFPASGGVVGGETCVDGTVWDYQCFDSYIVSYKLSGSPTWSPVNAGIPTYTATIVNDPVATWDTVGMSIPDGLHELKIEAEDVCGNTKTAQWKVSIDNTAPTTEITAPTACEAIDGAIKVVGSVDDTHLAAWVLEYAGEVTHGWVPIASGNSPITNGVIAEWDTSSLAPCAYVLRLRASDHSVIGCGGPIRNESEFLVTVDVGGAGDCVADVNGDGVVDPLDSGYVLSRFGPCP